MIIRIDKCFMMELQKKGYDLDYTNLVEVYQTFLKKAQRYGSCHQPQSRKRVIYVLSVLARLCSKGKFRFLMEPALFRAR